MADRKSVVRVVAWSDLPFPRVGDERWQRDAVQWMLDAYGAEPRPGISAVLRSSPYAVDYLRQAPVIGAFDPHRVGKEVSRGVRVKEVLARLGLAFPLRRLAAGSIRARHEPIYRALSFQPPSLLAQALPSNSSHHEAWLKELTAWRRKMDDRRLDPGFLFTWATIWAAEAVVRRRSIEDIADFAALRDRMFNPDWTFDRALKAATEWHVELTRIKDGTRHFAEVGMAFDEPVDYGDLPIEQDVGPYRIVALRSGADLHGDGRAMRHCVASYASDVVRGKSRIFSIRKGDTPLATLEIRPTQRAWNLAQIKGPCNATPDRTVQEAADLFIAALPTPPKRAPVKAHSLLGGVNA